jgi:deazaflavin-dependent oxidoreductase (nitroreductase family)
MAGVLRRVDPQRRPGPLYRAYARVSGTRPMGWLSRKVAWKIDPWLLRRTNGRVRFGMGIPMALLETTGAKSGQPRANAVIYFHDGKDVIVIASKLGLPEHPAWFHNVRANPDVRVNGDAYRAEVVGDEAERERLWALADRVFPAFAVYRERAARAGRTIPILRLRP